MTKKQVDYVLEILKMELMNLSDSVDSIGDETVPDKTKAVKKTITLLKKVKKAATK